MVGRRRSREALGHRELLGRGPGNMRHRLCVWYWPWPMALAAEQHNGFRITFPVPTLREGTVYKELERNWQNSGRIGV